MKHFPFFILLLSFSSFSALATVRLPAIFGDHMVLQQNTEVTIWGWADTDEKLTLNTSWDTVTYKIGVENTAKWRVKVKTPAAGGPYTITIKGYNTVVINDILIGEVWLCSGQSNMEMHYGWGVKRYDNEVANSSNNSIRFFHIPRLTAETPQEDLKGEWVVCNPSTLKYFSLVGYFFGREIQKNLKVPVGLINASWGGTPVENWTPAEKISSDPTLSAAAGKLQPSQWWPAKPGVIYNAEINPIVNFNIAGALWYQGEANVGTANTYSQALSTMIASWRRAFGKDFPFYFVQIAPYEGYGAGISSALLREQQEKTLSVPKTGMVVIHDLVDNIKDIHPQNKLDVGIRLANLALADTYGKNLGNVRSPLFKAIAIEKNKVRVSFENVGKGLIAKGRELTDFYIAGEDKVFVPAKAKISGNTVLVWAETIKNPVAVRFGFSNSAMPNLFSKEGLPVGIFRTDSWDDVNTTK